MSEFPISDEARLAAAKALGKCVDMDWERVKPSFHEQALEEAEATIQAFLTAEAFQVDEEQDFFDDDDERTITLRRLVSPWKPVSGGGDE